MDDLIDRVFNPPAPPEPPAEHKEGENPNSILADNIFQPNRQQQLVEKRLAEMRSEGGTMQGEPLGAYLTRRAVPFVASLRTYEEGKDYRGAVERLNQRTAWPSDIEAAARHQYLQEVDAKRGTGAQIVSGLAHVPAILGEGAVMPGGQAATAAEAGPSLLTRAGLIGAAKRAPLYAAEKALQTPAMPSLYVGEAERRAQEHGGSPGDVRNMAPALALGAIQNIILGTASESASGVPTMVGRLGARTAIGMAEQQGADVLASAVSETLPEAYKLETGYGLAGEIVKSARGDKEARPLQHAIVQAATFLAFSVANGGRPELRIENGTVVRDDLGIMKKFADATGELAKAGFSEEAAAQVMADPSKPPPLPDKVAEKVSGYAKAVQDVLQMQQREAAEAVRLKQVADQQRNIAPPAAEPNTQPPTLTPPSELTVARDRLAAAQEAENRERAKAGSGLNADVSGARKERLAAEKAVEEAQGWPGYKTLPPPEPGQPQEGAKTAPESTITPTPPTAPEAAQPAAPAAREAVYHITDYKEPAKSAETALTILGRKGSGPRPLETWDAGVGKGGGEGFEANFKPGHVGFEFDTQTFTGTLDRGSEGKPQGRGTSTDPLRYNPGLKRVIYRGRESDPNYGKLREMVAEINTERADPALMKEYGREPMEAVKLDLVGRKPGEAAWTGEERRKVAEPVKVTEPPVAPEKPPEPTKAPEPPTPEKVTDATLDAAVAKENSRRRDRGWKDMDSKKELEFRAATFERLHAGLKERPYKDNPVPQDVLDGLNAVGDKLRVDERFVLEELARGATHRDLADRTANWIEPDFREARVAAGKDPDISHQAIAKIEQSALKKIGVEHETVAGWKADLEANRIAQRGGQTPTGNVDESTNQTEIEHREETDRIADEIDQSIAGAEGSPEVLRVLHAARLNHQEKLRVLADLYEQAGNHPDPVRSASLRREIEEAYRTASRLAEAAEESQKPPTAGGNRPAAVGAAPAGSGPFETPAGREAGPPVAGREAGPAAAGQPIGSVGAATALPPTPTPPPGTPGAEAPIPPPPERPAKSAVAWFRSAKDFIDSLAQKSYPALTRLSARAGELLGETSNAKAAAKAVWAYMGQRIQVNGKPLADLPPEAQRELGATWLEMRMRHERERLDQEHRDLLAKAGSTGKPEDYQAALDARLARDEVRTLIGTKGSPLKDEAMFDGNVAGLFSFFDQIRQHWTPEVDRNYEGITGRDPNDPNSVQSQIPGLPLNAIALDPNAPGAVATGGGKAQSLANLKIRKPGMTRHASLSAEAYDVNLHTMMQRTLMDGISAARKAEFVRQSIKDGVIQAVKGADAPNKGWEYLALDPARGLKGLDPEAQYYVDPVAAKDVEQGLGIGRRPGQLLAGGIKPVMDVAYNIALLAPVELATHVGNQFTALFRPGMGNPLSALGRSVREMIRLVQKDPESLRKVAELTKMSAAFGHEAKPGWAESAVSLGEYLPGANAEKVQALAERVGKYDPTTYFNRLTSGAIDIMQKAVRIQLSEAYDRVVAAGEFTDTPGGKRDFINQALGNYNAQAGNRIAQFLKDSGLQSFATAAHTFTAQGVKSLWGGAINARTTGPRAELMLRSRAVLKLLPVMALGPVINALVWGQAFPQGVPVFAIKTGEDEEGVKHWDQLGFTGLRRGAKATFVNATVEGLRKGETGGQIVDRGLSDLGLSAAHAVAGPPAQTAYTAATGKDMMGRQVAEQVSKATTNEGIRQAAREGKPLPGESQRYYDAKAALVGLNPLSKILSERETAKQPKSWWQAVMQSAGPFGEKTKAPPPAKKK